ncbi:MAG TPA: hypothetical protein PKA64_00415 [Myxococcota bacterium]|nr:hypothetical protein [Myxococcota bacterium]
MTSTRLATLLVALSAAGSAFAVAPTWFTYPTSVFHVRPDYRRCISPLCGGYWIERVNQARMRCPDGTTATSCYVASIEWAELGLDPRAEANVIAAAGNQQALVRGDVVVEPFPGFPDLGVLHPDRVWLEVVP